MRIETISATIQFLSNPWKRASFRTAEEILEDPEEVHFLSPAEKQRFLMLSGGKPYICQNIRLLPEKREQCPLPDWKEVRQLYFHFQNNRRDDIRRFYQTYGPLLPGSSDLGREAWEAAERALDWFRGLTAFVDLILADKVEAVSEKIEEYFENPSRSPLDAFQRMSYAPWASVYLNRFAPRSVVFPPDDPDDDLVFPGGGIRYGSERDDETGEERSVLIVGPPQPPKDKGDLTRCAWEGIVKILGKALEGIRLTPQDFKSAASEKRIPEIIWEFRAEGALQAAFLKWFFDKVARVSTLTCEAKNCDRMILSPRKGQRYCSRQCYQREKKSRQRDSPSFKEREREREKTRRQARAKIKKGGERK